MQRDIKHQWFFQHSSETVWEFLTTPELISQWLMENNFRPIVGHQFQFKTKPRPGFNGVVHCQVLEVLPCQKLSYSWKGGPGDGTIKLDSVVTWTLTAKDKGTLLLLEHTGFKGWKNFIAYLVMDKGWKYKVMKRFSLLIIKFKNETTNR
jgi:uncharacterized protein YndB with AHSA1/START domain